MNSELDDWKVELREAFTKSVLGIATAKDIESVGYAYQCYAPSSIYKYYSDDSRNLDAIKDNLMWYSAPSKFNDVFDVDFSVNKKAIFESILKQVPDSRGIKTGSPMWRNLQATTTKAVKDMTVALEPIRHTTGVSCFSESEDSLLMWAHYAHNHRGICIEYELMRFNRELMFSPVPIIYSDQKPSLQTIDLSNPEEDSLRCFIKCLTTKSKEWSYEKEWRIIRDDGACGSAWDSSKQGALLPSVTPSSILLGCEASEKFEKAVREYCEENSINLFKMEKSDVEYKLIKRPILTFAD